MKDLFLNRDAMRELDRRVIEEFGIPGIVLMENAGRGVADYLLSHSIQGNIVICCGKGNNAGDGFVIARHLDNAGLSVHIVLISHPDTLKGDTKINYTVIEKSCLPITIADNENSLHQARARIAQADWIIDAIFGTGLQGVVQPPYDEIIQVINASHAKIVSVDIPSGLDCDSGEPLGSAVKADDTVTLVCLKKGFMQAKAKPYLGNVQVIDIGIPKVLIAQYY